MQTKRAVRLSWYAYPRPQTQWSWQHHARESRRKLWKYACQQTLLSIPQVIGMLFVLFRVLYTAWKTQQVTCIVIISELLLGNFGTSFSLYKRTVSSSKKFPIWPVHFHVERQSYIKSMDKKRYLLGTKSKPDNIVRDAKLRYWFQP